MGTQKKTSGRYSEKHAIPAKQILAYDFKPEPPVLSRGILPAAGGMIVAGDSGVGKSLMRVEWSVLLAAGLPVYGIDTPRSQSVLVFQAENTISQEQFRMRRVCAGLGMESVPDRLFYAPPVYPSNIKQTDFMQYVEDRVAETAATVVFFDPLISYHCEPENDNVRIRSALDAFTHVSRSTGCACVLLHHFGKPSPDSPQAVEYRLRGAQAIRDWADTAVTITPVRGLENERYAYRRLDFIKIRNGPYHPPLTLRRTSSFLHEITEKLGGTPSEVIVCVLRELGQQTPEELSQKLVDASQRCSLASAKHVIKEAIQLGTVRERRADGMRYLYLPGE